MPMPTPTLTPTTIMPRRGPGNSTADTYAKYGNTLHTKDTIAYKKDAK